VNGAAAHHFKGSRRRSTRASSKPILLGGAPRGVAILNGTVAAALALGLQQWLAGLVLWAGRTQPGGVRGQARPRFRAGARAAPSPAGASVMLRIAEYRSRADRLADHLPWAALVAPGVVLNKDGSFQRSFRFRGPDLESATEAELVGASARVNNVLRRFGSGWALFFEAERRPALGYPESRFPDPVSWLVDKERQASFEGAGEHFESAYHLTLLWLPPADSQASAERALVERRAEAEGRDWREALSFFLAETNRALDLLSGIMPEVRALDDEETLTHLHGAVSAKRHRVAVPETPVYLDALLADTPLTGGLEPLLGGQHLRTVTVLGFPGMSRPGILDALNHQDFGYRWTTRFIALDKAEATRALTRLRRQWFNKRKSVTALLREVMYNQPVQLTDSNADNKVMDADLALQALGQDYVAFGYLTATITVADQSAAAADEKVRAVERVVNGLGFTAKRERLNAVEAWLSSLPGHVYANVRQPLVHTLNLAHLMPLSSVWAGPARNAYLAGPPLLFRRDQRLHSVPALDACRRRRPHADRRADRRRQVGAARPPGAAVPALPRRAGLHVRQGLVGAGRGARRRRRPPRAWHGAGFGGRCACLSAARAD
jgi:type IV secretory pathway VirB4 component